MCGFLGKISNSPISMEQLDKANIHNVCRGPDALKCETGKFFTNSNTNKDIHFNFMFNRLSIIDLSENAMQPMYSKNFSTWIMFNGEIYNHRKLKKILIEKGVEFFTDHSDTEVLLNGISYFGLDFLNSVIGQFAIMFYDEKINKMYLVRDRVGQKPLFYMLDNKEVLFGSNLKSIVSGIENVQILESSLNDYINFGVITSPNTLFKNIYKVEPGSYLEIDFNGTKYTKKDVKYWDIDNFIDNKTFEKEEFFEIYYSAVNLRLESDVPVANFLSGGIDSTSIIKALNDNQSKKINTFSITNKNSKYDESFWINQVHKKYNTNHISSDVSLNLTIEDILNSINIFDELYCDPSTVPSYILNREISKEYKVAISGDGGDELLGGYKRFNFMLNTKTFNHKLIKNTFNLYPGILGTGNKILKYSNNRKEAYTSYFSDSKLLKLLNLKSGTEFGDKFMSADNGLYKDLLKTEYKFYLFEMMTTKVDRTSMANSVEVRSPFLDHRLIEYVLKSENSYFIKKEPKKILKDYLTPDFDESFLNREKQGFVFDLEKWVFENINFVQNEIKNGKYINNLNPKILSQLTVNKSRINGLRIWKLFFLEKYLEQI
ncbi:MAG: asparagine synthase (glutamine-hydrolyzing) [Gammaproteobacteria bacterium TMED257]|nr:MAG: asparagine synthase (glutamine-hydrolyzing) [Gammaproteobacteria bacterium TMED257]